MRVLMMESDTHIDDGIAAALADAGHELVRCHEPVSKPFPCAGVEGDCPVDDGIDVAITLRRRGGLQPSVFEDGVTCAIRAGVPLVVAGRPETNPFAQWSIEVVEPDAGTVLDAAERAATAPVADLTEVANEALTRLLADHLTAEQTATATVTRNAAATTVHLEVPESVDEVVANRAAVMVMTALRERTSPPSMNVVLTRT